MDEKHESNFIFFLFNSIYCSRVKLPWPKLSQSHACPKKENRRVLQRVGYLHKTKSIVLLIVLHLTHAYYQFASIIFA